jgi:gas vesicle protein
MKTGLKVIAGFLAGTATGALFGLLFAPSSGKKTRRNVVREVRNAEEELEYAAQKKLKQAKEILDDKVEGLKESGMEMMDGLKKNFKESVSN